MSAPLVALSRLSRVEFEPADTEVVTVTNQLKLGQFIGSSHRPLSAPNLRNSGTTTIIRKATLPRPLSGADRGITENEGANRP